jgi:hypothetical protein
MNLKNYIFSVDFNAATDFTDKYCGPDADLSEVSEDDLPSILDACKALGYE